MIPLRLDQGPTITGEQKPVLLQHGRQFEAARAPRPTGRPTIRWASPDGEHRGRASDTARRAPRPPPAGRAAAARPPSAAGCRPALRRAPGRPVPGRRPRRRPRSTTSRARLLGGGDPVGGAAAPVSISVGTRGEVNSGSEKSRSRLALTTAIAGAGPCPAAARRRGEVLTRARRAVPLLAYRFRTDDHHVRQRRAACRRSACRRRTRWAANGRRAGRRRRAWRPCWRAARPPRPRGGSG